MASLSMGRKTQPTNQILYRDKILRSANHDALGEHGPKLMTWCLDTYTAIFIIEHFQRLGGRVFLRFF